jgi:hypothetical protein
MDMPPLTFIHREMFKWS